MATFVVYVNLPMLLPELPMKPSGTIISSAATQHTTFQIEALDWTQIGTALDEAVGSVTDAPDQRSGKLAIRPSGGLLSERRASWSSHAEGRRVGISRLSLGTTREHWRLAHSASLPKMSIVVRFVRCPENN